MPVDGVYDIAVVGGGINGAGIARDAALRGLKVILLEKNDFGSGTSSWSSRLIHGGLRYLEHAEIPLVFESLHERRRLRKLAGHLVEPLRLTIPVYKSSRRGMLTIRLGMLAYDILSFGKSMPGHRMLDREAMIHEAPGLMQDELVGGAQYYDAQVAFAERLVLENVLGAAEAGADVRNYSPVIGISVRQGRVRGLQFIDHATTRETEIAVPVVVNAAGPWVDRVLATVNREMPPFMGGTKGSHIVVGPFEGAPSSAFYVEAESDGRPFFIIPWFDQYLIGTTDIRYDGDPGDVVASDDEIDYLVRETNRVFPAANLERDAIHYAYAGVRPLQKKASGPESAITRKHIIYRHRREARGLISIIGGKLTTYRNLAEQAVNKAVRSAGLKAGPCLTRSLPLPGAEDTDDARQSLMQSAELPAACADRLLRIYGSRAIGLAHAGGGAGDPFLDTDRTILAAEVAHAVTAERAVTLVDIMHRRMMVGLAPDQGRSLAGRIGDLAAEAAGWNRSDLANQQRMLEAYNDRLRPG